MATPEELRERLRAKRDAQLQQQQRCEDVHAQARQAVQDLIVLGYNFAQILELAHGQVSAEHLDLHYKALGYFRRKEQPATGTSHWDPPNSFGSPRWLSNVKNYTISLEESEPESASEDDDAAGPGADATADAAAGAPAAPRRADVDMRDARSGEAHSRANGVQANGAQVAAVADGAQAQAIANGAGLVNGPPGAMPVAVAPAPAEPSSAAVAGPMDAQAALAPQKDASPQSTSAAQFGSGPASQSPAVPPTLHTESAPPSNASLGHSPANSVATTQLPSEALHGSEEPAAELRDTEMPDTDAARREPEDAKLPDAGPQDAELPDAELPDSELPDSELPDAELPDAELPGSELPDSELPDAELPVSELPNAGVHPDVPDSNAPPPRVDAGLRQAGLGAPRGGAGGPDDSEADSSSEDEGDAPALEESIQEELRRVQDQIRAMQERKLAKEAQREAEAAMQRRTAELSGIAAKRAVLMQARHKLNLPKLTSRVSRLESKLKNAKEVVLNAAVQLKDINAQSLELEKKEIQIRNEFVRPAPAPAPAAPSAAPPAAPSEAVEELPSAEAAAPPASDAAEPPLAPPAPRVHVLTAADSPLRMFGSWRLAPLGPRHWFSPSFNGRFVRDLDVREFCSVDLSGEACVDRDCEFVHFRDFDVPPPAVVEYMATRGAQRPGFKEGLVRALRTHLSGPDATPEQLAAVVVGFRQQYDAQQVLDWDAWGVARPM